MKRSTMEETTRLHGHRFPGPGAGREAGRCALVILQGAEADIGTCRWVDEPVSNGRDPTTELPLDDLRVSRRHCLVQPLDGKWFVEDLGSSNGTRLNRKPLSGRVPIEPGDNIFLGDTVLRLVSESDTEMAFYQQMSIRASTDDLTGLVTSRRFHALLLRSLGRATLDRRSIAVVMLDLDGIRRINEAHGHDAGGHTIAEVGRLIGRLVGGEGAASRVGGDEFALYLEGFDRTRAMAMAARIREAVQRLEVTFGDHRLTTTISAGVVVFPEDGRVSQALVRKADEALRRAKAQGGNCVSD